jgi:hypothetical protein
MTDGGQVPRHLRFVQSALRFLFIIAVAFAAVGGGTALFWSPRAAEGQPLGDDLVAFASSQAIAGVVAAAAALATSGEIKLARAIAAACLIATVGSVAAGYFMLWVDPSILRGQMDAWSFLRLRHDAERWAQAIFFFEMPFAAAAGGAVGLCAGILFRLASRSRRNAMVLALGLLAIGAIEPARQALFAFLNGWGWAVYMFFPNHWISPTEISTTGAVFGSVTGSAIACVVLHLRRRMAAPARPLRA